MWRLIDRSKKPPKPGYSWIDPITTLEISGPNYPKWIADAVAHRVGNRNPLPTDGEMEDQLCGRLSPQARKQYCQQYGDAGEVKAMGVGSTLKSMLAAMGVSACWGCINLAKRMDDWGPDGCEEHMPEILEIMQENAAKRRWMDFLPFKETGSELLVRLAIKRVRNQ